MLRASVLNFCARWSPVSAACRLCRQYFARGEPSRNSYRAADQVRSRHQSDDSQSTRHHRSTPASRPRRRGDRMIGRREFITLLGGAAAAWPLAARAQQPRERIRGRVVVADLIVLLGLAGLGAIDPAVIAQEVVGEYRWRMAMDPTVLTVEQEKAKAAKPGSDFRACANGCPVMIGHPCWQIHYGLAGER